MASTVMTYHMIGMESMMKIENQEQVPSMSVIDHSKHAMGNDFSSDSETSDEDCCDGFCNCFTSGCSPLFSIHRNINNDVVIDIARKINSSPVQIQSQIPTSLYRPPIIS